MEWAMQEMLREMLDSPRTPSPLYHSSPQQDSIAPEVDSTRIELECFFHALRGHVNKRNDGPLAAHWPLSLSGSDGVVKRMPALAGDALLMPSQDRAPSPTSGATVDSQGCSRHGSSYPACLDALLSSAPFPRVPDVRSIKLG